MRYMSPPTKASRGGDSFLVPCFVPVMFGGDPFHLSPCDAVDRQSDEGPFRGALFDAALGLEALFEARGVVRGAVR